MQKVLKKRYQPNFYYCLKESLKKLRREKLLKNFIKNSEPKSALRKKNKVIKNWLNKIPDTNRMKLKIRNLFKNYLLTKKIKFQVIKKGMELQEKEKLILNCIKENDIDIENQNSYKMKK